MSYELTDFDLDVINVLNDFPIDDHNSCLYVRGCISDKIKPSFVFGRGTHMGLASIFFLLMKEDKNMARSVFNAVFEYLKTEKEEAELFLKILTENDIL